MPSVTYMNNSAPFWDFVASLENQGRDGNAGLPPYSAPRGEEANEEHLEGFQPPSFGPWGWGHGFGGRGFPHRGGRRHRWGGRDSENENEKDTEKNTDKEKENEEGPSGSNLETEGHRSRHGHHERHGKGRKDREGSNENGTGSGSEAEGCRRRGGRGRCGEGHRGRHAWGPYAHDGPGHHGPRGFGPFGHGPHGFGPRGSHHPERGHGGRGGFGGPWGGFGGFNPWTFAAQFLNPENYGDNYNIDTKEADASDFSPEADIFDTPTTYVIHVSLPGAKKEDVGVNWDADKSELSVAGVIYRPGDEEFLKTLAMDERKIGPFERKIRLGTRVNPAQIDADGITAKLEDGILRIEVPKKLEGGFVEVRKVDIE